MSRCSIQAATPRGVDAIPVTVEVEVCQGLPGMEIVGMGDASVQEAKQRVRSALHAAGFSFPGTKVVVNLAPAALRKTGSGFDLPIALGVLTATGQIDLDCLKRSIVVGELSLNGDVRQVRGMLAYAIMAKERGMSLLSGPGQGHAVPVGGLEQLSLASLTELRDGVPSQAEEPSARATSQPVEAELDYADIAGQEFAKRAMQIAAAGGHGIMLVGPPGSGKTMLARRLPTILPPLTPEEALETALVHSVAGLHTDKLMQGIRPFRAPHHSATAAGLIGGGSPIRPGEVSLAHNGVLFLDEMPEFSTRVLQMLRQPMEDKRVVIVRADGSVEFPASFMLVAASNPCPCGFLGDPEHRCKCSENKIAAYQTRIGGPVADRIDMRVDVARMDPANVMRTGAGTSSASLRGGVMRAWERRRHRLAEERGRVGNINGAPVGEKARLAREGALLVRNCRLSPDVKRRFTSMAKSYKLSGRGVMSTLRIARTIADVADSDVVALDHILEAMAFRTGGGS